MRAVPIQTSCRTAAAYPPAHLHHSAPNVQVHYVLDHPKGKDWKGGVGYVTEDIAKASLSQVAQYFLSTLVRPHTFGSVHWQPLQLYSQAFCK